MLRSEKVFFRALPGISSSVWEFVRQEDFFFCFLPTYLDLKKVISSIFIAKNVKIV